MLNRPKKTPTCDAPDCSEPGIVDLKADETRPPRPERVTLHFCPPHADYYEARGYAPVDPTRQLALG